MTSLRLPTGTSNPKDTNGHDRRRAVHADPFEDLLVDPGPPTPLFRTQIISDRPLRDRAETSMPPSVGSDLGASVSVPSSTALDHPLIDFDSDSEIHLTSQASATTDFFDRYMDGAKERADENERRVLGEILEHESNPLFSTKLPDNDTQTSHNSFPSLQATQNAAHSVDPAQHEDESFNTSLLPKNSPPITPASRSPSSSQSSAMSTSTLPRKWMPNFLSHNTLPTHTSSQSVSHISSSSPSRKTILPVVTHASPFASHIFVPPTGAPGFTNEYWNKSGFEFQEQDKRLGRLELAGQKESTNVVLTVALANQLRSSLPALSRLVKTWMLLYSLDQHGVSLQTLYSRCQYSKAAGTLLAVRDSNDHVFGVWLGEQLRPLPGSYYGGGESFLWRCRNVSDKEPPQIFRWTGKNEYVALCEPGFISFGGGDGKYGLYLEANLMDGSSAYCPTFDNDILCSWESQGKTRTAYFECVGIEIWGVGN